MNTILMILGLVGAEPLRAMDNMAPNPSFEEDRDRDTAPDGWRAFAFDSPAKLAWDKGTAHSGSRSLRISDSFRPGDQRDWKRCTGRWVSISRPAEPGTSYRLSVWVKTQSVTGHAYAHIAWERSGRWLGEVPTKRLSGSEDWTLLSVTAVAAPQADSLRISFNLSRSKGTAWFDDVKLAGRSEPLPQVTCVFNDTDDWFPFTFPLDDTNLDSIDLTGLLEPPAGKYGFVTVGRDGHFYFEDGRRARFIGTNVGGQDCAPPKDQAPIIAARLAKYGLNMLRLHSLDGRWGPLIDYSRGDSQHLDAEALDRMDFFVAELQKRGIYIYMDLLDYRQFRTADGVAHGDEFTHNWQGSMKGASIFDQRMIELQKDYATKLLAHRNPYTGLRYVDDPAMAVVEITNENSVFYFLTMSDLSLPYYRNELTERWNRWLASRYKDRSALAAAWTDSEGRCALKDDEDPARGTVAFPFAAISRLRIPARGFDPMLATTRLTDVLKFLTEVQRRYYETMHDHLRRIGVRVPVAGTNQFFLPADTHAAAETNDFMSRNQYWRHPARRAKPFFRFSNQPLVRVDIPTQRNPLAVIARTSVAGKPQAVAEYNFPWPNEYRCEGWLLSAAYACLQDWDIFLYFSYDPDEKRLSMFRSQSDPARWGELPAAALLFHRHDVSAARNEVHVVHTPEDTSRPRPHTRNSRYTNQRFLVFLSKVREAFLDDTYRGDADVVLACGPSAEAAVAAHVPAVRLPREEWEEWLFPEFVHQAQRLGLPGYERMDPEAKRFDSDTGELSLDYGQGLFTINTPRTKAAVGFLQEAGPVDLQGLRIDVETRFAAVSVSSVDGQAIGRSRRLLVTAVARAENTSQGFWPPEPGQEQRNAVSWMLPGEGRLPVIAEPVRGKVEIAVPAAAAAYALDETGRRRDRLTASNRAGVLSFDPATARSIWCEVIVND